MKKLIALIGLSFTIYSVSAQYGQIQNGGFENWTDQVLYDTPTDWTSSNMEGFYGVPTVSKSTDAQEGSFSAKLETVLIGTDTISGYVYHGSSGATGPDGGIPYTANFEAISLQYKSNLPIGDTLFMISIRYVSSVAVEFLVMPVAYGTNSIWTPGVIYIGNANQDELFIGFVLGNPFGGPAPTPGASAMVDNVKLLSGVTETTPVPNAGFETWTEQVLETPDNWYTLNELLAGAGAENSVKTTDANTGSFAMEMSTILLDTDTINAILSMGSIDVYNQFNPFALSPYAASPTTFSGAYKYIGANGDQGGIQIQFFEAGNPIGFHMETFNAQATYTSFSSPLTISGTPDSILFLAFSGDNPGSVLKLDDLQFSGGNVGLAEFASMKVNVYPNPAHSSVMIKATGIYDYTIIDLAGNIVGNNINNTGPTQLDVSHLSSGAYILRISNKSNMETHKLIIE